MHGVTFNCKTITPMFLAGADKERPELRAPSIKGAMRFWWRAVKGMDDISKLKEAESKIFGGTGEKEGRSKITVRVMIYKFIGDNLEKDNELKWKYNGDDTGIGYLLYSTMLPNRERSYIKDGFPFSVRLSCHDKDVQELRQAIASFWVLVYLGGLGNRSRRGGGNMVITSYKVEGKIKGDLPDFVIGGGNSDKAAQWLRNNFQRCQEIICPGGPKDFATKYSNLAFSRFIICNEGKDSWQDALNDIGKKFKDFREDHDFWSGSFIFSYLMAETARKISSFGAEIFLPSLENNPLCFGDGIVTCGSVPDQIYVLLNDDNKAEIEDVLKDVISETLKDVVGKIEAKKGSNIDLCEINNFFNFFHIIHEIKNHYPTHKEFIEAEQKIKMRAAIRPFNQLKDQEWIPKWKKCSLCGDRKGVYSEPVDKKDAGHYEEEHICNVCILKRCLPKIVKEIVPKIDKRIVEKSHYQSTSDIALSPIKVIIDDNERKEFGPLIDKCKKETEGIDISEGRYFYDVSFKKRFANWREDLLEKYPELSWLDRPFYSIVYMDGDNMGEILKGSFPCIKDISKILSQFSNAVSDIVSDHHGQLIFAGGEDVNFIIHPEYLLDCIDELNGCYKGLMGNISEKSTLSAGAIVCYHKYPLSQAILKAGKMLHDHAKKYSGKNATAISLIKGHRETTSLTISNSKIKTLEKLKESLLQTDISRTTPYRIKKEIDILNRLADLSQRRNYLYAIIAGTRGLERTNKKIEELVDLLMEFGDVQTAINALLYTRFLIGEKKNA